MFYGNLYYYRTISLISECFISELYLRQIVWENIILCDINPHTIFVLWLNIDVSIMLGLRYISYRDGTADNIQKSTHNYIILSGFF